MKKLTKEIPIVFATNDNYLPYLSVALKSLINNADNKTVYRVFIFQTTISDENKQKILEMKTNNVFIEFFNVSEYTKNNKLYSKDYFSIEMFYRILIADLLPQYEKVLYLDCDLILNTDPAIFFDIDLNNNLLAAVKNEISIDIMLNYVVNILKLKPEEYFNSGVLLINTKLFRDLNIKTLCFEFIEKYKHLACPDQDVLNLFCYGKVKFLDSSYNFQAGNELWSDEFKLKNQSSAKIIHYTSSKKPWNTEGFALADYFWKIAKQTPYYDKIKSTYEKEKNIEIFIDEEFVLAKSKDGKILEKKKHSPLTFPFRMIKKTFKRLKQKGLKTTFKLAGRKLKFFFNFLIGKVNKNNQEKIKDKHLLAAKQQISINKK